MQTVLRPGLHYLDMYDTEIRGFLDGSVKFRRNVATQYHVRIGCEASGPKKGRYEVMRALQRWDLSPIPPFARVKSAVLTLTQEDLRQFPHRNPLLSSVDFYIYEVKKDWGPGLGGVKRDNQSEPEPGDAWWIDAKLGNLPWTKPGCGFGSDTHPDADRAAEPLAFARLESLTEPLVLSGPRLAAHVELCLALKRPLDLIVKLSDTLEARPGSIRAFYSREFGDSLRPIKRPSLVVDWTAPTLMAEHRPFVLEPGQCVIFPPELPVNRPEGTVLCASLSLDTPHPLEPAVFVSKEVLIASDPHSVAAGELFATSILETWTPHVKRPEDLRVQFQFTAPSGRFVECFARLTKPFLYTCEYRPDELGVWRFTWRTRPDTRFPAHEGGGHFTVVRGEGDTYRRALRDFAGQALAEAGKALTLVERVRLHSRLTRLEAELLPHAGTEDIRRQIAEALARLC